MALVSRDWIWTRVQIGIEKNELKSLGKTVKALEGNFFFFFWRRGGGRGWVGAVELVKENNGMPVYISFSIVLIDKRQIIDDNKDI